MGIIANVYRTGKLTGRHSTWEVRDCTLNGWSSQFDQVCVVNASGPFEPSDSCPGVMVFKHCTVLALHAVLVEHHENKKWTMMGGNFLHSTDSRFGELCRNLLTNSPDPRASFGNIHFGYGAVPIHDRIEN